MSDSDRWITPKGQVDRAWRLLGRPDLDPFHDPASKIGAAIELDHRGGWDAYAQEWPEFTTALINGPYSADGPGRTRTRSRDTSDPIGRS